MEGAIRSKACLVQTPYNIWLMHPCNKLQIGNDGPIQDIAVGMVLNIGLYRMTTRWINIQSKKCIKLILIIGDIASIISYMQTTISLYRWIDGDYEYKWLNQSI